MKRKPFQKSKGFDTGKKLKVNQEIRAEEVRLIDDEGAQIGVFPKQEAILKAQEKSMDLVEVVPKARPPVAKIMDYGKYQYIKKKQEKKNKLKSKQNEVKGIRLGVKTEKHDIEIKRKKVEAFLQKGYKVSIDIILKGREKVYMNKAREVLKEFVEGLDEEVEYEDKIKKSPRGLNAVIKKSN